MDPCDDATIESGLDLRINVPAKTSPRFTASLTLDLGALLDRSVHIVPRRSRIPRIRDQVLSGLLPHRRSRVVTLGLPQFGSPSPSDRLPPIQTINPR